MEQWNPFNEIGHVIFKNPKIRDLQEALEKVTWPRTNWDRIPTGKYQLFPFNLNIKASVWFVFIKKNIMPTRHDSTISMERIIHLYCIMMEISMNVGEIICEHLIARVKHPRREKPFLLRNSILMCVQS